MRGNGMIRVAEKGDKDKEVAGFTMDPHWRCLDYEEKKTLSEVQNRRRARSTSNGLAKAERRRAKQRETSIMFFFVLISFSLRKKKTGRKSSGSTSAPDRSQLKLLYFILYISVFYFVC